jgi:hypothetical protein
MKTKRSAKRSLLRIWGWPSYSRIIGSSDTQSSRSFINVFLFFPPFINIEESPLLFDHWLCMNLLLKLRFSSRKNMWLCLILAIMFRTVGFNSPKDFQIALISTILALNVPSEGYYRTPMRTNSDIYVLICTEIYKIMSLLPQKFYFSWPGLSDLSNNIYH